MVEITIFSSGKLLIDELIYISHYLLKFGGDRKV